MAEKEVIIDIAVNSAEAVKNIQNARAAIADLKEAQKELAEAGEVNSEQWIANEAAIRSYSAAIKANQKEIDNNIKKEKEAKDSLVAMRAELSNLTKEYDSLSASERNGAKGKELLEKIKSTTEEVKTAETATMRYQRNVGNYPKIFDVASGTMGKFATMIQGVTGGTKSVGGALKNAGAAVSAFGKQLLSLLANPIVAIIAAIAAVLIKLVQAFKKNDDAMTALSKSFQIFQPIIDAFNGAMEAVVGVLTKGITLLTNMANAIMTKLVPGYAEASKAAQQYIQDQDNLEEAERQYTVNSAKRSKQISELRAEVSNKDKYTAAERKKMLAEAVNAEAAELQEAQHIAIEKLRLAKEENKRNKDTSDEAKNRIAQLTAEAIKTQQAYFDGVRKLRKEYNKFDAEEQKEEEAKRKEREQKAKEWAQKRKQQMAEELTETRKLQDIQLAALAEGIDKMEQQMTLAAQRQIEDIDKRIANGGLTKKTKEALEEQKRLISEALTLEVAKLHTTETERQLTENLTKLSQHYQRQLEIVGNNEEEKLRIQLDELENERLQAVRAEGLRQEEIAEINELYEKRKTDLSRKAEEDRQQVIAQTAEQIAANDLERELQAVRGKEEEKTRILYEEALKRQSIAQQELTQLQQMTNEEAVAQFGNLENWEYAIAKADAKLLSANEGVAQSYENLKTSAGSAMNGILGAVGSIGDSMNQLFTELAGNDEKYADFATGMALMQILVSTAISIANAVQGATAAAAATGPGAPIATPIFIAEMVGIVTGAIVSATTTLLKAKKSKESAPKFATGGLVTGPGSGTSDSINAKLSNGEFVVNAAATAKNLPLLAQINGGIGRGGRAFANGGVVGLDAIIESDYNLRMQQTMIDAVTNIRPVVSVKEITRVANRVTAKEMAAER